MKDSEPKFTPGPWHIEDMWHILDKSGYMIASTSQRQDEEEAANAALIAAAPDMYALLEDIASYEELHVNIFISAIQELLAKARGEIREKA
jgi:hypothetical protein